MSAFLPRSAGTALRAQIITPAYVLGRVTTRVGLSQIPQGPSKWIINARSFVASARLWEATEPIVQAAKSLTQDAAEESNPKKTAGRKRASTGSKATTKTKAGEKAKPKKKAKAKSKKKAVAKPKKKAKKVVDPEKAKKIEISGLKKTALLHKEPKKLPYTTWTVYMASNITRGSMGGGNDLASLSRSVAATFRELSPSELETFSERAQENQLANNAAHRAWVESHTAAQVHDANKARKRLRYLLKSKRGPYTAIPDERQPKRNVSAWSLFHTAHFARHYDQSLPEASRAVAAEWKSLSDAEKQPYVDLALAGKEKYAKECAKMFEQP